MAAYILALVLLLIALLTISLRKTYNFFPARELKRLARAGDHDTKVLWRAVAYGGSLRLLLWLIIGVSVAASFVLLTLVAPVWLVAAAVLLVIWYAFAWAPHGRVTGAGARFAVAVTPLLAWILHYTHRPLDVIASFIERHRHITFHTGLFERADLIELVNQQREMKDSRISHGELDIVLHALSFGEKTAASVMVPGREVKTVNETDSLGPILMDELYESDYSRFPVIGSDGHTITGTLYLRDMVTAREGGTVRDVMKKTVYYVHETQSLYQVLHAFMTTKNQLFIVINDHEQYVGIITIEDVIDQILGHRIVDDFDSYDDKSAVANYAKQADSASVEEVPVAPETLVESAE
jgi:CBS domain containing-hemolysin-like protein